MVKKPTITGTVIWAGTENGRKWNFQKSFIYKFVNNKAER